MNFSKSINNFSNKSFVPNGWYWLAQSTKIKKGKAIPVKLHNKDLVLFRTTTGKVSALDAHCPHMGAHLCDGKVESDGIRCPFHYWKFNYSGECVDIPVQSDCRNIEKLNSYIVEEHLGLIWIWTGDKGQVADLPISPELENTSVDFKLGKPFVKNCHPNVVMVNAIDAHHFTSVHNLVVDLKMEPKVHNEYAISFDNVTPCPPDHILFGRLKRFYKSALTYTLKYWWGHTGAVTLGPDFLHFYIIFALRPGENGNTEGQTILLTQKRKGILGRFINSVLLAVTKVVGNYFAKGDTLIFEKIKFDFKSPVRADRAIIEFIRHYEKMQDSTFNKPKPKPNKEEPCPSPLQEISH